MYFVSNFFKMRFLFSIVLLFSTFSIYAQDYEVTHYTVEDGLMSNDVKGVFQDSLGVIWVANGLGFTKLYGDKVENVESPSLYFNEETVVKIGIEYLSDGLQIGPDQIRKINHERKAVAIESYEGFYMTSESNPILDKRGYYWAFSKDSNFVRASLTDTIDLNLILQEMELEFQIETRAYSENIIADNNGDMWIRTKDHQIHKYVYDKNEFETFKFKIPFLTDISFFDEKRFLAFGSRPDSINFSLFYNQGGELRTLNIKERPREVLMLNDSSAYVIFLDGLYLFANGNLSLLKTFNIPRYSLIAKARLNADQKLFFMEDISGGDILKKYSNSEFQEIYRANSNIKHIFIDSSNKIWVSTDSEGLVKIEMTNIQKRTKRALSLTSGFQKVPQFYKKLTSGVELYTLKVRQNEPYVNEQMNLYMRNDTNWVAVFEGKVGDNFISGEEGEYYFTGNERSFSQNVDSKKILDFLSGSQIPSLFKLTAKLKIENITPEGINNGSEYFYNLIRRLIWAKGKLFVFKYHKIYAIEDHNVKEIPIPKASNQYYSFPDSKNDSLAIIVYRGMEAGKGKGRDSLVKFHFATEKFEHYNQFRYNNSEGDYDGISWSSSCLQMCGNLFGDGMNNLIITDTSIIDVNQLNDLGETNFKKAFILDDSMYGYFYDVGIAKIDMRTGRAIVLNYPHSQNLTLSFDSAGFWHNSATYIKYLPLSAFKTNEKGFNVWTTTTGLEPGIVVFEGDSILRVFNVNSIIDKRLKNKYIPPAPKLHFTQLRLNYENFDWSSTTLEVDSIWGNVMPNNMELAHDQNHLTFDFQGVSHSNKKPLTYYHQLVGEDEKFVASINKSATYSNLEPGDYTFNVYVQDENESKSEILTCSFTVSPPFWETWWFIGLCMLGIGGTLYSAYNYNVKRLKSRQEELENEVEQATKEIRHQKDEIEESHREITDSINYAERIQRSFLATTQLLNENLNEYFVYFNPKEAVSGDFYWAGRLANGNFALVNADSTGHGVPGAIMSILNISSIEKAVDQKVSSPAEIFNETRKTIIQRLKNDGSTEGGKDGMDASLIAFNADKSKMSYVAAQNPIWVIRDGELTEIKPEKMPVGKHDTDHVEFVGGEYDIQKGDVIYTLTDGFQDQFGGSKGKKFMIKKMREYVLSISNLPMAEQHQKIKETFTNWQGDLEQIDDVCVIAVRI
jgi:serine phosphatase RsbU (regulator of sigma subunit)